MNSTSNQTKQTAQKAESIRRLRAKGWTWERTSIKLGILKENGDPDPGLAYKIAEGYEPKGPAVRARLGLKALCLTCMRGFRKQGRAAAQALTPWASWWKSLSPKDKEQKIRAAWKGRIK